MDSYKYDVAFSFLSEDEHIAKELDDFLKIRAKTFFYPEKQEDVADPDAEISLYEAFNEARTVIVLYRESWGQTEWTRIEETAIRKRAYYNGYEFVLYITLKRDTKLPKYLPPTKYWVDFDRWKINGALAIIEKHINDAGGSIKVESVQERAERLIIKRSKEKELKKYFHSVTYENDRYEEIEKALAYAKNLHNQLNNSEAQLINGSKSDYDYFISQHQSISLSILKSVDDSDENYFKIRERITLKIGLYKTNSNSKFHEPHDLQEEISIKNYIFNKTIYDKIGWYDISNVEEGDTIETKELLNEWYKKFLDTIDKHG